ncbi:DNA translocase FtsK [Pseudoroseicyclus aestuarii]|uniref:DNA translocase FtsK n=1 Tax=Pseudoroseicyclus aestuarii TaxID=1795041 RepID=A0A318STG1_9RHOB|nr:DNA translocase FtsK [Pseudoroseicyclus aestuarii]PYE84933.1 DNA translocase FtsK [Pseudoroseicyclus aestuarii]
MAYQTRGREPLFDSTTQAALEKRGKELLGLALLALAMAAAMLLGSYSAEDPNWMLASDAPVQNWLGRPGASIAQPVMMIVGRGAWAVPLVLLAWGIRMLLHRGEDRAVSRAVFAPIAVALASVFFATLGTPSDWPHSFGLGGLFGDTVLGLLLTLLPFGVGVTTVLLGLVLAAVVLLALAFVSGFTAAEIGLGLRLGLLGLVMGYDLLLRALGQGAQVSMKAGSAAQLRLSQRMQDSREARAERRAAAPTAYAEAPEAQPRTRARRSYQPEALVDDGDWEEPAPAPQPEAPAGTAQRIASILRPRSAPQEAPEAMAAPRAEPAPQRRMPPAIGGGTVGRPVERTLAAPARAPEPAPQGGFLSRMPQLLRRDQAAMPEPELVDAPAADWDEAPDDDRIRARITDAVRARAKGPQAPAMRDGRIEPALTRGCGPRPLLLNLAPRPAPAEPLLRETPPLTRGPASTAPFAEVEPEEMDLPEPEAQDPLDEMDAMDAMDDAGFDAEEAFPEPSAPAAMPEAPRVQREGPPSPAAPAPRIPVPEARKVVQHPPKKPQALSSRAQAEAQPDLPMAEREEEYEHPPLNLLMDPARIERHHLSDEALEENARMLESVLDDYGVKGEIVSVRPGPVVTMYELEPAPGLKASRVIGLADDIARSMSALSARVSTVPGRSVIGIELPNASREMVVLREILAARQFGDGKAQLPLALGKDIGGEPIIANLAKMPHLLIAGTTGSGKSVAINTMILSLLYKLKPSECRLIMIDPKMLELSVYDGIPHLLSPVVTDPKKAVVALKWVVGEMEERYRKMSKMGVRNIDGYNGKVKDALERGETFDRTVQTGFDEETGDPIYETEEITPEKMPYIVVIVDEMADLMMVAGKEIEACIQRLAQMARASGIHLIMATQRPSVDVITGTIKANFPTRISFQVTSKIDSRTILGEQGAEQLLGMGDMLYMAGGSRITRVHGPFCSDEEVEEIVSYLKSFGPPEYVGQVVQGPDDDSASDIDAVLGLSGGGSSGASSASGDSEAALYDTAVHIVAKDRKCSTSYIQRKLGIGYNKAARLVEQMEDQGVVSPANHVGKREVLVPEVHH